MEVEIKVPLEREALADVESRLERLGVRFGEPQTQRDVYFKQKQFGDDYAGPALCMIRVRYSPAGSHLTMKHDTDREGIWEEVETPVGSGETAERILRAAGAQHVVTVEKSRRAGKLGHIDILLDDVRQLGLYLEVAIETNGHSQQAQAQLFTLLERLGFAKEKCELRGYPRLLFARNSTPQS